MKSGEYSTCTGIFTSSGGLGGNYSDNENHNLKFKPPEWDLTMCFHFILLSTEAAHDFFYMYMILLYLLEFNSNFYLF